MVQRTFDPRGDPLLKTAGTFPPAPLVSGLTDIAGAGRVFRKKMFLAS